MDKVVRNKISNQACLHQSSGRLFFRYRKARLRLEVRSRLKYELQEEHSDLSLFAKFEKRYAQTQVVMFYASALQSPCRVATLLAS